MIIHPNGRLEGTPEELAAYQKAMTASAAQPIVIEKPVYIPLVTQPQPNTNPLKWTEITCGGYVFDGPPIEVRM